MTAVWNNETKPSTLADILAGTNVPNAKLALLTGVGTITDADSFATITALEVSFTGYARQTVSGWSSPSMAGHRAVAVSALVVFTNSGGSASPSINGWALLDTTLNKVIIADKYSAPFTIAAGTAYTTAIVLTFRGEADTT